MISRIDDVLNRMPGYCKQAGDKKWITNCPAHEDRSPSLSIAEGEDGRVLLHCHSGCAPEAIVAAIGLNLADLMPPKDDPPAKANGKPRIVATYDYCDESGKLLFQSCRFQPKDFRQRKPDGKGDWIWSVKGVRPVPYRLPELLAEPSRPVVVCEGEKDAEALRRIEVLATTNAGGAGKWKPEFAEFFAGRRIAIIGDNDDAGRTHAQQVAQSLHGVCAWIKVIDLPGLPTKGDVSDWIAAGGDKNQLKAIINATPNWAPAAEWPELIPFDERELPPFPAEVLPSGLRDWVEAESHATQTPSDLAGLLSLSVCAATIARRVVVEPRRGWTEPVNLFTAVLLEPGNRKSGVFADALKPLRELEERLIEEARPAFARALCDRRQDEARLKRLEKLAADKGDPDVRHQARELAAELATQPEPVLPRRLMDDVTSEKLGMTLADQGGRIASMSPEGGVFDLMAGLYSKNGIPQFGVYLMGHSGDDLVVDRVSRKSVHVQRPALTCAYAMQPQVIEGVAENVAFRGRGLLARFLYSSPRSWIGRRKVATQSVEGDVRDAYHAIVRRLDGMLDGDGDDPFTLRLSADSGRLMIEWETEIEQMLGDGGELEMMRDWGAKLAGATLRIAAVLHCVACGLSPSIGVEILRAAVEIARYLIPHAEAVLALMEATTQTTDDDARYVLRWIQRHKLAEFTKRDAHRHGIRRFTDVADLDEALSDLERRGYIRLKPQETIGPGRPPSPAYEVNPFLNSPGTVDTIDRITTGGQSESNCVNSVNTFQQNENENPPDGDREEIVL